MYLHNYGKIQMNNLSFSYFILPPSYLPKGKEKTFPLPCFADFVQMIGTSTTEGRSGNEARGKLKGVCFKKNE